MIEVRIEQLLEERGKSFYWLAKETGIGYTSLWRLRHEEAKTISFNYLERICRALECEPGDLFVLREDAPRVDKRGGRGRRPKPRESRSR
ncbi:MAG TPA: helix-turn-helix transcriptional regulator [Pyrinomonadaceae bacterium]|nr:helix-turn-helix transcriptional regulator [Pyrinomonadaceae bacterium]